MLDFRIVVPFYNGIKTIHDLIKSVPDNIEIIVVDDHSTKPLTKLPYNNVTIVKGEKKGYFAGAVNIGMNVYTDKDVLVLNQDVYFNNTDWIPMLETAIRNGYSYIGERIKGTREDWPNGYIHGTFMYLTRDMINTVGKFNTKDFPMWGCTAEYQLKAARAGYKILPIEHVPGFVHVRGNESYGESFKTLLEQDKSGKSLYTSTPPLVSVVIPTHNYSAWLSSTVNSLIGGETSLGVWPQQTFGGFEVIIVDDSSTDNTPDIIKGLADPWKGVRSIRLNRPRNKVWDSTKDKYIGKVHAMNHGISKAYGKYIMILDADDMVRPDRVERFYREIVKNPKTFVYDNLQIFGNGKIKEFTYPDFIPVVDERGQLKKVPHPKAGQTTLYPKTEDYDFDTLIYKNQVHSSIMFSKEAWYNVGGYPERFIYGREDWAMAVNLGWNGYCGVRLPDYHGLLYRREGHNRTLGNTTPTWMAYFRNQMREEFRDLYRGKFKMGCCGNGASRQSSRNQAFSSRGSNQVTSLGSNGTTWLTYIGNRTSGEVFSVWGYASNTQYRVHPGTPFLVDSRDLRDTSRQRRGLLERYEANRLMFRVYEQPVEAITEIVEEEVPVDENVMFVQESSIADPGLTDILDTALTPFYSALNNGDYTRDELNQLLAAEMMGRNRRGAITAIEEKLDALTDD